VDIETRMLDEIAQKPDLHPTAIEINIEGAEKFPSMPRIETWKQLGWYRQRFTISGATTLLLERDSDSPILR
jgi:hypothetical protein